MAKDVLDVLADAKRRLAERGCSAIELGNAIDKLSELIAADVERVEAESNYITCDLAFQWSVKADTHKSPERAKARRDLNDAVLRRNAAIARQEAALAACRGL